MEGFSFCDARGCLWVFLKSAGGRGGGATPRRDHRSLSPAVSLPDFTQNYLFILFLRSMDELAETRESKSSPGGFYKFTQRGCFKSLVFYGTF